MSQWPSPSPEQQVEFLQNLQRLFEEGDFTATYKYALLIALAELAVEQGDNTGAPLEIEMSQLAEKFAELYWPQTVPYSSGAPGSVPSILSQNPGEQAAIVNRLLGLRSNNAASLAAARQSGEWRRTLAPIASVIRNMPVRYLQNVAGARVPFLYDYPPPRGHLVLRPGVAFSLRRFQGLVQQPARSAWVQHVRGNPRNAAAIGRADDLEAFMFGSARADLSGVAPCLGSSSLSAVFVVANVSSHPPRSITLSHGRGIRGTLHTTSSSPMSHAIVTNASFSRPSATWIRGSDQEERSPWGRDRGGSGDTWIRRRPGVLSRGHAVGLRAGPDAERQCVGWLAAEHGAGGRHLPDTLVVGSKASSAQAVPKDLLRMGRP
jgi:hypothetical protein